MLQETKEESKPLILFSAPELDKIEPSRAEAIRKTFEPMVVMLGEFEEAYNSVMAQAAEGITGQVMTEAKAVRLAIAKVRIENEALRKEQKEEYLRGGKAIDAASNILKWAVVEKEKKLKAIEDHFAIEAQKRLEELEEKRTKELAPFVGVVTEELGGMSEDVWQAYLSKKKKDYNDLKEAEAKAEADRVKKEKADAAEREKLRKQNEKLLKEKKERDAKTKAEREKLLAKERATQAKLREKHKAEADKRKAAEAKKKEAEAELKAAQKKERERLEEIERQKEIDLRKGDAAKVKDLVADLVMVGDKYTFKSKKNRRMYKRVRTILQSAIDTVEE